MVNVLHLHNLNQSDEAPAIPKLDISSHMSNDIMLKFFYLHRTIPFRTIETFRMGKYVQTCFF